MTSKEVMAELEHALSAYMRPTFLAITNPDDDTEGDMQVIISANGFAFMSVQERVSKVFDVIKEQCPNVIKDRLIVVQTYDSEEMTEVLNEIFTEELR